MKCKKTFGLTILGFAAIVCSSLGVASVNVAVAQGADKIVYDANGTDILASTSDIFGVSEDGEFGYSGFEDFTTDEASALYTWTENFGTEKISYWSQAAFSAVTLTFEEVSAADYGLVQIGYMGNNWGASSLQYVYVFSSSTEEYIGENAICSYVVPKESNAHLTMEIPTEKLADENGKISSITIARGASAASETVGGKGWLDYIAFSNPQEVEDSTVYTELYVEDKHHFTGPVYAFEGENNVYAEIKACESGYVFDEGAVSKVQSVSKDLRSMTVLDASGTERTAQLVAVDLYLNLSDEHRGFGENESGWEELLGNSKIDEYITINGVAIKNLASPYKINTGGPRTLYVRLETSVFDVTAGNTLTLEIPKGTKVSRNYQGAGFEFVAKTVCALDKETLEWTVATEEVVWETPTLGEKELSDCSHAALTAYFGAEYEEITNYNFASCSRDEQGNLLDVYDENGRNWHTNSQAEVMVGSGYCKTAPKGDGSQDTVTGNFYKVAWTKGLDYPATVFSFPIQTAVWDKSDNIVIRLYVDGKVNASELWFTNVAKSSVDNPDGVIDLFDIEKDTWVEVKIRASKFLNEEKTGLNPIGITFYHNGSVANYDTCVYFDGFRFETCIRNVKENYTVNDISEVVPVREDGFTFVGEGDGNGYQPSYYTEGKNIAFCRMDATATAIKMKVKVAYSNAYDFYFTMNAPDIYYDKGGVNYWISHEGVSIGSQLVKQMLFLRWEELPEGARISSGEEFLLEIGAVPYMVEGVRSGYKAYMKINNFDVAASALTEDVEEVYVDEGDVGGVDGFGSCFGLYLHGSDSTTVVSLYPVAQAAENPLEISLKTRNNVEKLAVGDTTTLLLNVSMELYGATTGKIEVLDDSGAYLQGRNNLIADKDGKFRAKYTYTCSFGTFESNTLDLVIGKGPVNVGAICAVGGGLLLAGVIVLIVVIKKKKQKAK